MDAAMLAELRAEAQQDLTPPPADPQAPAAAPPPDPAEEAREVIAFVAGLVTPLYPGLSEVYDKDTVAQLAAAGAPLMQKYGLSMGGLFERWGAEIRFLMVAGPVLLKTALVVRATHAARQAAPAAAPAPDAIAQAAAAAAASSAAPDDRDGRLMPA